MTALCETHTGPIALSIAGQEITGQHNNDQHMAWGTMRPTNGEQMRRYAAPYLGA